MTWDSSSFLNQSPCTYLCLHQKLNWLHHTCIIVSAHICATQPKGSAQAIPALSLHHRETVRWFFFSAMQKSPKGPNDRPRKSLVSSKVLHFSIPDMVLPGVLGIELDTPPDLAYLLICVTAKTNSSFGSRQMCSQALLFCEPPVESVDRFSELCFKGNPGKHISLA